MKVPALFFLGALLFCSGCFTKIHTDAHTREEYHRWIVKDARLDPKTGAVAIGGTLEESGAQIVCIIPSSVIRDAITDKKEIRVSQWTGHKDVRYSTGAIPRQFSVPLTDTSGDLLQTRVEKHMRASALPGLIFTLPTDVILLPIEIPIMTGALPVGPQM